jgi:hypothetical protein
MSATSNKSRLLLFLMIAISLVFFVASFLAAALAGSGSAPATSDNSSSQVAPELAHCMVVRTGERTMADCSLP